MLRGLRKRFVVSILMILASSMFIFFGSMAVVGIITPVEIRSVNWMPFIARSFLFGWFPGLMISIAYWRGR